MAAAADPPEAPVTATAEPPPSTTTANDEGGGWGEPEHQLVYPPREDFPSKSAWKKAKKRVRNGKMKELKKAAKKEERKAEQAERMAAKRKRFEEATPEERQVWAEAKDQRIKERKLATEARRRRLEEASEAAATVVIDLQFGELMLPHEHRSLAHQLMYCYSANSRADKPCRLCFAGMSGPLLEEMQRTPGYDRWPVLKESRPYFDAFADRKGDLVYLTADSDVVLEKFDEREIYVIGGLVDRNRHKGVCASKAAAQGIRTAQLPIREHVTLQASTVLTVNQVFDIYGTFQRTGDWTKTFTHVIPTRKIKAKKADEKQRITPAAAAPAHAAKE